MAYWSAQYYKKVRLSMQQSKGTIHKTSPGFNTTILMSYKSVFILCMTYFSVKIDIVAKSLKDLDFGYAMYNKLNPIFTYKKVPYLLEPMCQ